MYLVSDFDNTVQNVTNTTTVTTTTVVANPIETVAGNTQSSTGVKGTLSKTVANSNQQGIYAISFIFIGLIIVAFAKRRAHRRILCV